MIPVKSKTIKTIQMKGIFQLGDKILIRKSLHNCGAFFPKRSEKGSINTVSIIGMDISLINRKNHEQSTLSNRCNISYSMGHEFFACSVGSIIHVLLVRR